MKPKFEKLTHIGGFMIVNHHGWTNINPRNDRIMSKDQHWYRVRCHCGTYTYRSQQELVDPRRIKACNGCLRTAHIHL